MSHQSAGPSDYRAIPAALATVEAVCEALVGSETARPPAVLDHLGNEVDARSESQCVAALKAAATLPGVRAALSRPGNHHLALLLDRAIAHNPAVHEAFSEGPLLAVNQAVSEVASVTALGRGDGWALAL